MDHLGMFPEYLQSLYFPFTHIIVVSSDNDPRDSEGISINGSNAV